MAVVTPTAKAQFIDAAGIPLAGGFLYTYEAGTTTPQATYTDSTAATANSNPIVLDSRGEANIWLSSANYKFKLTDANGTEIWTVDNIAAPSTALSPVFSSNVTISANTSGPALLVTQTGAGAAIRVQDSADPDSSPFVVDTTGQVGIGTATPANAIDVAGGAIQISTSGGTARTVMSADATDSIFAANDARNFTVKTNSATRLTINASAATFAQTVAVTGDITATGSATITGSVTAASFSGAWANIPAGTVMLFVQTAAPTGWTKSTTHDNKALRVVSGSASSGGSVAFTTAFASQSVTGTNASYTLTTADIPSHTHTATQAAHSHYIQPSGFNGGSSGTFNQPVNYVSDTSISTSSIAPAITVNNTGGGGGHTHTFTGTAINLAVQYVDVIIATKN